MLVDGAATARIPVDDRGLQYGDGLFETIAVRDGRPCLWDRHSARLRDGCRRLGLGQPDPNQLLHAAQSLLNGRRQAVLKILVTRGSGGRGYRPPGNGRSRQILQVSPWPEWPAAWHDHGVRVRYCDTPLADSPAVAGLKHLGRLEQVLARAEWDDPDIGEGLMLDAAGSVIEATQSNVFAESDGQLVTPPLTRAGVAGVVRGLVMDLALQTDKPVMVRPLAPTELTRMDSLYLTNSLIGVWRVAALADHVYPADRAWHPVMRDAMEAAYRP